MAQLNLIHLLLFTGLACSCCKYVYGADISCNTDTLTKLGMIDEEFEGLIEEITGVPAGATLSLRAYVFPEHLQFINLSHSGGDTAGIVTTKKLDAEAIKVGTLMYAIVCKKDGAEAENARELQILDINDNAPVFAKDFYNATICETTPINEVVLKVHATDADVSPDNNILSYSLTGSFVDDFEIRIGDGTIFVKKRLNYDKTSKYNFTVTAADIGLNSSVPLEINIEDYDTMNPYFIHSVYQAEVAENTLNALTVFPDQIEARDGDKGINEKVIYKIKHVNPPAYNNAFIIDKDSGVLALASELDRETISLITVTITAVQQDNEFKSAEAVVFVRILDVNDNPPSFEQDSYTAFIQENSPDGTIVIKVEATDKDEGGFNGKYSISTADSPFEINDTGVIFVKDSSALDREHIQVFYINVTATEHMAPHATALAVINITLLDENDNSPVFQRTPYEANIFNNMTAGMSLVTVVATDSDRDANGEVQITLEGGNDEGYFHLDEVTGQIILNKTMPLLEENTLQTFTLMVTATDGGGNPRASSVPVKIIANGYSHPRFVDKIYEGNVEEEKPNHVPVVTAKFISSPHSNTTLTLLTSEGTFAIDSHGTIWTNARLDYETQQTHSINVSITDGLHTDYTTVFVKVIDINDNPPQFSGAYIDIHVLENVSVGYLMLAVLATDDDSGYNAAITYSLNGGDGVIKINATSGQISVVKELDRETQAHYNLTVTATDQGQPPLSSIVTFSIIVDDVNDNHPIYNESKYEVEVLEDEAIGTVLLTVYATDLDEGINAQIIHRITKQSPNIGTVFTVNATTGELTLVQELDYESVTVFKLEVEAADQGSPTLSSTSQVLVHVLDINDNPPEFSQNVYNVLILENLQQDAVIFAVNITDKDENGFADGHFTLNDSTLSIDGHGVLSLLNSSVVDREVIPGFTITVWATDAENGGLNSSALLNVTIIDVNDNNPQFTRLLYNFTVFEDNYLIAAPTKIGQIEATDLDEGDNGHVTFHLMAGEGKELFKIEQSGVLSAVGLLDRETVDQYKLQIIASDNGIPCRQNVTDVIIDILDVNDNPPRFTQTTYTAMVIVADAKVGDVVLTVAATDPDLGKNGLVTYSFLNETHRFAINNETGKISVVQSLADVTTDTELVLQVTAKDNGDHPLTSTALVIIYMMTNVSDSGLVFESSSYNFAIPEHEPVKTNVGTVKALTGSIAVSVTYFLKSHSDKFSINNQGELSTLRELDREERDSYTLIVEAMDSRSPANTAVTMVMVTVNDINDHVPEFSPLIQTSLLVLENQASHIFGTFPATDKDIGQNAMLTYSLDDSFGGVFYINGTSGLLLVTSALDRETRDHYTLNIVVTDAGTPPLSASLEISIKVDDMNDNPPIFTPESYNVTIKENEPPTLIVPVKATDADTGFNAITHYMLVETSSLFHIGELSGEIVTLQPLDYEVTVEHTLKVMAFNPIYQAGDPFMNSTAVITVMVLDVNEEGPEFIGAPYYVTLLDNAVAGFLVININATDENMAYDEEINYSIAAGNINDLFTISPSSGEIRLTKDLPSTTVVLEYVLTVIATDSGIPQLSNSAKVTVTVAPRNTSFPIFSAVVYQPNLLSEKTLPDTLIIQTIALYNGAPLIYSFTRGNDKDYFRIETSSGVIKTQKALKVADFPQILHVMAADLSNPKIFSTTSVNITVIDENDFPPVFTASLVNATLLEEEPESTEIIQLTATDVDTGRNGDIRYGILSKTKNHFKISPEDGRLYSNVIFDYEEGIHEYQVVIYAEDDGIPEKKTSYCTVVVRIMDINDWAPAFELVESMAVEENAAVGTIVGKVIATDRDTGDNAFIVYDIAGGHEKFEINGLSGIILIKNSPDYETENQYILMVTAKNNKTKPYHQSSVNVTVDIIDMNDNHPEFTMDPYTAQINMIGPVGTHVQTVSATDIDQGNNGVVEYYLQPDLTYSQYFIIENPEDGRIVTAGNLPSPGDITLRVIAKDRGNPALNTSATVNVRVVDNRPFIPQFNETDISTIVMEDRPVGTLVQTFSVMEASGKNIHYRIMAGNEDGHFKLEENTGKLFTEAILDYETISQYIIFVEATDSSSLISRNFEIRFWPQNVARTTITIGDVNEAPVFAQKSYTARIFNTVPYKFPVIKAEAKDPDSADKDAILYSLLDHTSGEFDIDEKTGQIFTVSLNGKNGIFVFKVKATDRGGLSAQTDVEVTVEKSDNENVVVLTIDQKRNDVERNIQEVKSILESALQLTVYIIDVFTTNALRKARSVSDLTFIKILATDNEGKIVGSDRIKSALVIKEEYVESEMEKIFGTSVTITVKEDPVEKLTSELIAVIVLSILLGCVVIAFTALYIVTLKRNKKQKDTFGASYRKSALYKNPYAAFENGGSISSGVMKNNPNVELVPWYESKENVEPVEKELHPSPIKEETQNTVSSFLSTDLVTRQRPAIFKQEAETLEPKASAGKLKGVKFSEVAVVLDISDEVDADTPESHEAAEISQQEQNEQGSSDFGSKQPTIIDITNMQTSDTNGLPQSSACHSANSSDTKDKVDGNAGDSGCDDESVAGTNI